MALRNRLLKLEKIFVLKNFSWEQWAVGSAQCADKRITVCRLRLMIKVNTYIKDNRRTRDIHLQIQNRDKRLKTTDYRLPTTDFPKRQTLRTRTRSVNNQLPAGFYFHSVNEYHTFIAGSERAT